MYGGTEPDQKESAYPHEGCGCRGPSLWLVSNPGGQHGQHHPADSKPEEKGAGDVALLRLDKRGSSSEQQTNDEAGQHGHSDNPTDVSPRRCSLAVVRYNLFMISGRGRHGVTDPVA